MGSHRAGRKRRQSNEEEERHETARKARVAAEGAYERARNRQPELVLVVGILTQIRLRNHLGEMVKNALK